MLFIFDANVAAQVFVDPMEPKFSIAIARLLDNYSDGHHVMLLDPATCKAIERNSTFSEDQRAAAKRIRNRFADYGSLVNEVEIYATVTADGAAPQRVVSGWEIPLSWLAANPLTKSHLLCEDLHDADVLSAAALDCLEESNLCAFSIRATRVQGGGGNTHRVLQDIALVERQLCLCVVDSDRKCPSSPLGQTAERCTHVAGDGLFQVAITQGRTIENELPWRLLDLIHPSRNPRPSFELSGIEGAHAQASKYLNLKRGLNGFDAERLEPPSRAFWEAAAPAVLGYKPTCCAGSCQAKDVTQCRYKLHSGFGGGTLRLVAEWLSANAEPGRSQKYLPSPNDSAWKALGRLVCAYTIGLQPRRI